MNLQKKIDFIVEHGPTEEIFLTEKELLHPDMHNNVIFIDMDSVEYFEGNSKTIRSKVDAILADYQTDLFRPIVVCAIEGATVNVVKDQYVISGGRVIAADGHHRKSIWTAVGMNRIPALVRTDLQTPDEVVDFYVRLNTSLESEKKTKKNIFDSAKKIKGTSDYIIDKVTKKYGNEVDAFNEKNVLGCIATLRTIVKNYGEWTFDRTMYVLTKAFRGHEDSLKCIVVKTIANHLHKHIDDLEVPGWIDSYINELKTRPATEWKKRWTPKSELGRVDTKAIEENIRYKNQYNPKHARNIRKTSGIK